MKAAIYTLGCKVNSYESEFIANKLIENGYEMVNFSDFADVYIINTCSVTNNSDSKSRKIIREAVRNNKDAIVVATGCFIEANQDIQIDGVDLLIGNNNKSKIVELIEEYKLKNEQVKCFSKEKTNFENMELKSFSSKTRAFVKIQDGCDNYCTYCIIPYLRGKCRSKNMDDVINEITNFVNNGYKEVVLTGIHTGNYGIDLDTNFKTLLEKIILIPNLKRIRISSIEITELNDEVLDIILNSKIVADHLHIPLQAGSDKILKLMNRKYDMNYYFDKINKIRSIKPDISISTDIIVGFPMENEDDFNITLENSQKLAFSKIHVFPYSKRSKTKAADFKEQVDPLVKKERAKKLIALSNTLENNYMEKYLNKNVDLLIEENDGEYSYGHTSNFLHVKIKGIYKSEDEVTVKIVDVKYPYVIGEKV